MQDWFDDYGKSHQNPINKSIHWICVPLIFFTVIGLLSQIPAAPLKTIFSPQWAPFMHVGTLLLIMGIFYFIRLSISIATGMVLIGVAVLLAVALINTRFPGDALWIYLVIFALAWVGQFIGHKIEGAKPSFLKDIQFLLIGPAWLLHFIYKKIGIRY